MLIIYKKQRQILNQLNKIFVLVRQKAQLLIWHKTCQFRSVSSKSVCIYT